jgi:hypothetical protein|tara:strand:- start:17820 stop:18737 length:918 start_codon:yes stop_codon:yes gene_type:complete
MSFANLKKKSGSFSNLTKEIEKMSSGGKKVDERFWKPQVDKSGNGFAVIRFLPESEGSDLPWAQVWSHAFQGPGGWLIDNCPTTKGEKCPVCAANTALWNSGTEADKDVARKQKRKLSYYSNIYVVKDPLNPDNEGKVFLYKYGKRIFDKLMAKMQPDENDYDPQPAFNPFDLWKGADFKLKIKQVAGFWNYDDSVFTTPDVLGGKSDTELEEVYNSMHDLASFTSDDQFKSYDELEGRMKQVLGRPAATRIDEETLEAESDFNAPDITSRNTEAPSWTATVDSKTTGTEDEDHMSYFAKLAEED